MNETQQPADAGPVERTVMQHTPGPWELVVEDGDMKIVAPPQDPRLATRETLMCDMEYYPWCPSNEADWMLIAAAPELLKCLRSLYRAPLGQGDYAAAGELLKRLGAA